MGTHSKGRGCRVGTLADPAEETEVMEVEADDLGVAGSSMQL